jgi:hypothetical protein
MAMELFHFTGADGADYTLPKTIKGGLLRKIRKLDSGDAMFTLFELVADEKTNAAIDEMEGPAIGDMYNEWMQGMSSGESSSSTV